MTARQKVTVAAVFLAGLPFQLAAGAAYKLAQWVRR